MPDRWMILGIRLLPHEFENLCELARMRGISLEDVVRQELSLPPERVALEHHARTERHLALIDDER
jgi:hypothetical protein